MNWADYLLGIASGVLIFLLWIVSVIIYAIRNQQKIAAHMMKRMVKNATKPNKVANANH